MQANSFSDFTHVPTAWKEQSEHDDADDDDDGNTCDHSMDFHLQDLSLADFLPACNLTASPYLSASPFLETHPPLDRDCLVLPQQYATVINEQFDLEEFQGEISVNDLNLQAAAMDHINVDISVDHEYYHHPEPAIDAIHRDADKMKHIVAIAGEPHQNDTQASSMGLQLGPSTLDEHLDLCGTHEISNKTRMRWTRELHDLFVQAVEDLGGPERATPKSILIIMGVEGLTMCQVKSHLQKYRLARFQAQAQEAQKPPCSEGKKKTQTEKCSLPTEQLMKETDTLHMQLELQKKLHYQLTVLRELQIQTEENGRRLQEFIENQREAFMMVTKSISSSRTVAGETPLVKKPSALVNLEPSTGSLDVIDVNSDTEETFPYHKRARLEFDHPKTMKFRGNI